MLAATVRAAEGHVLSCAARTRVRGDLLSVAGAGRSDSYTVANTVVTIAIAVATGGALGERKLILELHKASIHLTIDRIELVLQLCVV